MPLKRNKLRDIVYEIMRELYKNSEPSADFDQLERDSPWCSMVEGEWIPLPEEYVKDVDDNVLFRQGYRKSFDFNAYVIPEAKFEEILEGILSKYKKVRKYDKEAIRSAVYLGPSPAFKKTEDGNALA